MEGTHPLFLRPLVSSMKPEFWMGLLLMVMSCSYAFRANKMRGDPNRLPTRWLIEVGKGVCLLIAGATIMMLGLK